jgi:lipopolysaccharide O-acetyltransferase
LARNIGCSPLKIGKNPRILGRRHLSIGSNFVAGDYFWLEAVTDYEGTSYDPHIVIGHNVGITDFVHIAATNRVTIGDGVLIGSRVLITDHNHGEYDGEDQANPEDPPRLRKLSRSRTVTIGRNVWIGDGAAILGGSNIGDGCVIGTNSVVAGTVPSNCIAVGLPARPIRYYRQADQEWVRGESKR